MSRDRFASIDPASGATIWEGTAAGRAECAAAIAAAHAAFPGWRGRPIEERVAAVRRFAAVLDARRGGLAELIARETGKLLWEASAEVGSMISKVEVSVVAQMERAGMRTADTAFGRTVLRHHAHGVMAVLGPYNFPGHLPNGHIVPALLAGNTIVFKPSEITPATGAAIADAWREAGLPNGVFNLIQGGRTTGEALVAGNIDGLLFTGSAGAGSALRRALVDRPHVILALELGGNNPLVVWDSPEAAASIIVQSAFVTTGQRCSCARRLVLPEGPVGDEIVRELTGLTDRLRIASWDEPGEAFMGPLVSDAAASVAHRAVAEVIALGAKVIRPFGPIADRSAAFVTPAILDVTGLSVPDTEIFAPVLKLVRVPDFDAAIAEANRTAFGLSAGLVSEDPALWTRFLEEARAGVVNRNRPTTGAAGNMPFGGIGCSGNHRPSAYYAADYCAFPVSSFEAEKAVPIPVSGIAG